MQRRYKESGGDALPLLAVMPVFFSCARDELRIVQNDKRWQRCWVTEDVLELQGWVDHYSLRGSSNCPKSQLERLPSKACNLSFEEKSGMVATKVRY